MNLGAYLFSIAVAGSLLPGCGEDSVRRAGQLDGGPDATGACEAASAAAALRINEVMSSNEGAAVDEQGETDDFIEVVNTGDVAIALDELDIADGSGNWATLPALELAPGAVLVLWADDDPDQGQRHLPFKISAEGDRVRLVRDGCEVDSVIVPALPDNESFARLPDGSGDFVHCRYATPRRRNGDTCEPPLPPSLPTDVEFDPYAWPDTFPAVDGPLVLTELALRPAAFVEVMNTSDASVSLADYSLRIAAHGPGIPWPTPSDGAALAWPVTTLGPGERVAVPVGVNDVASIAGKPEYEGVVTVFRADTGEATERVDFMWWPEGAALTRLPDANGRHVFCSELTEGLANDACSPLASREMGDRVRHLRTPGDFAALAAGAGTLGTESVKFVLDLSSGDAVHLLSAERWALHYTFIRESIYLEPPLDRCDPEQSRQFDAGWRAFSQTEYFTVEGRRFLLGTLVRHGSRDLSTVEFALGDRISAEQARHAFFTVMQHVEDPKAWSLRPQDSSQLMRLARRADAFACVSSACSAMAPGRSRWTSCRGRELASRRRSAVGRRARRVVSRPGHGAAAVSDG